MECDFSEISKTGKIVTKYHSIDIEGPLRYSNYFLLSYGSRSVIGILKNESTCYQIIDELCQPWIQEIYDVDVHQDEEKKNSRCRCLRFNGTLDHTLP